MTRAAKVTVRRLCQVEEAAPKAKKIAKVFYCTRELEEAINNYSANNKMKKTDVIISAIEQFLEKEQVA